MPDVIIGISVLQPSWVPGIWILQFEAQKHSGEKNQCWIFIKDTASQGLPDQMPDYSDGTKAIWKFTRNGNKLDCQPSVNWVSWGFHNAGAWSTDYVEMIPPARNFDLPYDDGLPRYSSGSAVHYDLNCLDADQAFKLIAELRQQGILKP